MIPAGMIEDGFAWPKVADLAAALKVELERSNLPAPCGVDIVAGPSIIMDTCGECGKGGSCGGRAWVRLISMYPSSIFPLPDTTRSRERGHAGVGACNTGMAMTLEVGVVRCRAMGQQNAIGGFSPPTPQQIEDDARIQFADMMAMWRAIACEWGQSMEEEGEWVAEGYTPIQDAGGCGGGTWTVAVKVF